MLTKQGCDRLIRELSKECPWTLQDLFKIRDALKILKSYNLHDEDLLRETELFIQERRER